MNVMQRSALYRIVNRPLVSLPPRLTVCFSINFSNLCSLRLQVSLLLLHIQPCIEIRTFSWFVLFHMKNYWIYGSLLTFCFSMHRLHVRTCMQLLLMEAW